MNTDLTNPLNDEPIPVPKLSTGHDSTLGNYRRLCAAFFGPDSKATAYIDQKIDESPKGVDEPVLADEGQMVMMLMHKHAGG